MLSIKIVFNRLICCLIGVRGATLKGKNFLPQFPSNTVSTVEVRGKIIFWICKRKGMENC